MIKVRLGGTPEEVENFKNFLRYCENCGVLRILEISKPYANRGESLCERVYTEIEINRFSNTPGESPLYNNNLLEELK